MSLVKTRQLGLHDDVSTTPVGTIMGVPYDFGGTPPDGYLKCDGSAVSRTTYSDLFGLLATTYGVGDGSGTFNIPDFRGEFLRGSGGDAAAFGTLQASQNKGESSYIFANPHTGNASTFGSTDYGLGSGIVPIQMSGTGYPDNYGSFSKQVGYVDLNETYDNDTGSNGNYGKGYNALKVYLGFAEGGNQLGGQTLSANTESRPPNFTIHWVIKF